MDAKQARENRLRALQNGDKTYHGRPCKNCGKTEKVTKWSECFACRKIAGLAKLNNSKLMAPYRTKEKELKKQRNWRKNNPEKVAAQNKRRQSEMKIYYQKNKEKYFDGILKKLYGISANDYYVMFEQQNGLCLICKEKPKKKKLAVDHCHVTNKIRGLLCSNCNTGLGLFKDNENLLTEAINYLKSK